MENNKLRHNRNTICAKERIAEAVVELVRENDLSDITVSMVTEKAEVSKSTFYRYYHDIYCVYDELMKNFFNHCIKVFEDIYIKRNIALTDLQETSEINIFLPEIISFSYNEIFLFFNSLKIGGNRVRKILNKRISEAISDNFHLKKESISFFCDFFITPVISFYMNDLENGIEFNGEPIKIALDTLYFLLQTEEVCND